LHVFIIFLIYVLLVSFVVRDKAVYHQIPRPAVVAAGVAVHEAHPPLESTPAMRLLVACGFTAAHVTEGTATVVGTNFILYQYARNSGALPLKSLYLSGLKLFTAIEPGA
jgi:hypothetical protein